jgi:hypothetical protein
VREKGLHSSGLNFIKSVLQKGSIMTDDISFEMMRAAQEQIQLRNIELVSQAARKILSIETDSWRTQVPLTEAKVHATVISAMQSLGYEVTATSLPANPDEKTSGTIQDIFIIKKWLDSNSAPTTSKPVVRRQKEFQALLELNCWKLAKYANIAHGDETALQTRLYLSGADINKPTQAQRFQ